MDLEVYIELNVIFTDKNGNVLQRKNLGKYSGGKALTVKGDLLEKDHADYKVYLSIYSSIEDGVVYYPIQFANDDIYDKNLKAHYLFQVTDGGKISN